ncbi:hypothetical protein BD309DRAFT_858526 [Dichomitus squalens]|nr:hypothetical protein BD309DRAFT_858526 [Dichomitus squalens]
MGPRKLWVIGYQGPMGYGVEFPLSRLGKAKILWVSGVYGLPGVWVRRVSTVVEHSAMPSMPHIETRLPNASCKVRYLTQPSGLVDAYKHHRTGARRPKMASTLNMHLLPPSGPLWLCYPNLHFTLSAIQMLPATSLDLSPACKGRRDYAVVIFASVHCSTLYRISKNPRLVVSLRDPDWEEDCAISLGHRVIRADVLQGFWPCALRVPEHRV